MMYPRRLATTRQGTVGRMTTVALNMDKINSSTKSGARWRGGCYAQANLFDLVPR